MDMKRHRRNDTVLAEQAVKWLRTLARGGPEEHAEFAAWLKESPRHIEETLCAAAVDKALDRLDAQRWPDVSNYLADPSGTVIPFSEPVSASPAVRGRRHRRSWIYGVAAAIVGAAGWWGLQNLLGWHHYATVVGEQRALTLDDGSLAYLNTDSRLNVRFTAGTREVRLVDGEALFKVEHDPARPFLVRTDDAVIRAVGTQFNVFRRSEDTVVSVVEGLIEISTDRGSARFGAGEQASIRGGAFVHTGKVDIATMEAWRQRRLIFELDPLADVAAEFNRYNRAPRVRVEGEAARMKRFSGVFDANDPKSLVSLLATYGDLTVDERADEIVIRGRRD